MLKESFALESAFLRLSLGSFRFSFSCSSFSFFSLLPTHTHTSMSVSTQPCGEKAGENLSRRVEFSRVADWQRSIGNKLKYATIKSLNCEFVSLHPFPFTFPSPFCKREAANSRGPHLRRHWYTEKIFVVLKTAPRNL